MTDTFCPVPWNFQAIQNNGAVRVCCQMNMTTGRGTLFKDDGAPYNAGKDDLDRFYTKPSVVDDLLQHIDVKDYDVVVEPSAGSGSWSSKIEDCLAIDISPTNEDIIQGDFLSDDFFKSSNVYLKYFVKRNPPMYLVFHNYRLFSKVFCL